MLEETMTLFINHILQLYIYNMLDLTKVSPLVDLIKNL